MESSDALCPCRLGKLFGVSLSTALRDEMWEDAELTVIHDALSLQMYALSLLWKIKPLLVLEACF